MHGRLSTIGFSHSNVQRASSPMVGAARRNDLGFIIIDFILHDVMFDGTYVSSIQAEEVAGCHDYSTYLVC